MAAYIGSLLVCVCCTVRQWTDDYRFRECDFVFLSEWILSF